MKDEEEKATTEYNKQRMVASINFAIQHAPRIAKRFITTSPEDIQQQEQEKDMLVEMIDDPFFSNRSLDDMPPGMKAVTARDLPSLTKTERSTGRV